MKHQDSFIPDTVEKRISELLHVPVTQLLDSRLVHNLQTISKRDAHVIVHARGRLVDQMQFQKTFPVVSDEQIINVIQVPVNTVRRKQSPFIRGLTVLAAVLVLAIVVGSALVTFNHPPAGLAGKQADQTSVIPDGISTPQTMAIPTEQPKPQFLYVSREDGVFKLNPATGEVIWQYAMEYIKGPPSGTQIKVSGDSVYVVDRLRDGGFFLVALNTVDGKERWRIPALSQSIDQIYVTGDTIYAYVPIRGDIMNPHSVKALNAIDGSERWSHDLPDNISVRLGIGQDNMLVLAMWHSLYALNPDGSEAWRVADIAEMYYSEPIVVDGVLYLGTKEMGSSPKSTKRTHPTRFSAYDASNGTMLWKTDVFDGEFWRDPVVANGMLVACSDTIHAFDLNTGMELWQHKTDTVIVGDVVITQELVIIGIQTPNGPMARALTALHASDGTQAWTHPLDTSSEYLGSLVVYDNQLYSSLGKHMEGVGTIQVRELSTGNVVTTFDKVGKPSKGAPGLVVAP